MTKLCQECKFVPILDSKRYCVKCALWRQRIRAKAYRRTHNRKAYDAAYRDAHRDEMRENSRRWREKRKSIKRMNPQATE